MTFGRVNILDKLLNIRWNEGNLCRSPELRLEVSSICALCISLASCGHEKGLWECTVSTVFAEVQEFWCFTSSEHKCFPDDQVLQVFQSLSPTAKIVRVILIDKTVLSPIDNSLVKRNHFTLASMILLILQICVSINIAHFKNCFLLETQKKKKRQTQHAFIHWLALQLSITTRVEWSPKPKVTDSFQIFHVAGRNPTAWTLTT